MLTPQIKSGGPHRLLQPLAFLQLNKAGCLKVLSATPAYATDSN